MTICEMQFLNRIFWHSFQKRFHIFQRWHMLNYDVKLKGWLDQTEVELGRRLSNRAASFLAAVSAQDQLKNIIVNSLKKSASLRQNVNGIGAKVTHGPLEVMRHRIKSKRLQETV